MTSAVPFGCPGRRRRAVLAELSLVASMVRLHWALAAPAPHGFPRPLSKVFASHSLGSTDVLWPLPPGMAWGALSRTLRGQACIPVGGHSFTGCY